MARLQSVILAYNADWSLMGAFEYLRETIKGDEPCELCKITYGGLTKKSEWRACEKQIIAPVEEVYRNQAGPEIVALIDGQFPAVIARTDEGLTLLVGHDEMDAMTTDPLKLQQALLDGLTRHGITIGESAA